MDSETYQTRLIDNHCTGAVGCTRPTADDTSLCKKHLKAARRRSKLSRRRLRNRRAAAGQCRDCGTPKKPRQRCAVCAARRPERLAVEAVNVPVNGDRGDPFRRDNDGWKRFRGKGQRGAPGAAVNDAEDLQRALKALDRGIHALAYARSQEVLTKPRIQRRAVLNEALAHLGLAGRTVGEVTARNRPREPRVAAAAGSADATWDYAKPADVAEIAQARVGEYVYAPPVDATARKGQGAQQPARRNPPDLAPLRAALAERGLALEPEGAFYWLIVEAPDVAARSTAP